MMNAAARCVVVLPRHALVVIRFFGLTTVGRNFSFLFKRRFRADRINTTFRPI